MARCTFIKNYPVTSQAQKPPVKSEETNLSVEQKITPIAPFSITEHDTKHCNAETYKLCQSWLNSAACYSTVP